MDLKGGLEAWKKELVSNWFGMNVLRTNMMISSEDAGKVTEKGKLPSVVYRKGVGSNSIFCQFCRCWVHKICSSIRGKLKENSKVKCLTYANQHTGMAEDFLGIELNGQCIEIVEKFCYHGDTTGPTGGAVDSVITRIRSGSGKFRNLVSLFASRGLPIGAKGRLYSAHKYSIML